MKSTSISRHFDTLEKQRELFIPNVKLLSKEQLWYRMNDGKWSIGEHLYHLYLMVRMIKVVTKCSFVLLPYAKLRRNAPFETEIHDIFVAFQEKKGRGMSAPFVIAPPKKVRYSMDIMELEKVLEGKTNELKTLVANIEEEVAGHIRFFDPMAKYPNLIQVIQLVAIHEQHHFRIIQRACDIEGTHNRYN
ncbi:DinB family protein [Priestia taiwanensis]|uniref:Membrane protein n=1 Tax=Priestia taiwanensis TaxID=1347902 RepID=A0A917EM42_9BACI|nr:DinB family protein [Priestia taiwanensis]MBM7362403.1 hypothetical protein [Priestia taiwanensis]GGE61987.1 membrane protein [Priestia taiwanensis]